MNTTFEMSITNPKELRKKRKEYYPMLVQAFGMDQLLVDASILEAVKNAWKHGHLKNEANTIHVKMVFLKHKMIVRVLDQGKGFDWKKYHIKGDVKHWFPSIENLEESGRGITLLLRVMDDLRYNREGNECLLMKKYSTQG